MTVKLNGISFILWRVVDSEGHELDVYLQRRRDKKFAIRFLSRLLGYHSTPKVIVTDKLRSYVRPIEHMYSKTEHRTHKRPNNRAENARINQHGERRNR